MIDSKQASDALAEIDDTVRRVRQSLIYQVASLAMLMWGLLAFAGNIAGWLWPRYGLYFWIGLYAASIVGFVLFSFWETKVKEPLIPLTLFRSVPLSAGVVLMVLMAIAFMGGLFFVTFYLQNVHGMSTSPGSVDSGDIPFDLGIAR